MSLPRIETNKTFRLHVQGGEIDLDQTEAHALRAALDNALGGDTSYPAQLRSICLAAERVEELWSRTASADAGFHTSWRVDHTDDSCNTVEPALGALKELARSVRVARDEGLL